MLISPLARRLCQRQGIDPATLRGTGPRGRIMAADVLAPAAPPRKRGETIINNYATPPTRPEREGYYVYDAEVDMSALANISLPIAVQCEKLLEQRYSLFDYLVRAVVKACTGHPAWMEGLGPLDVLLFENNGEKVVPLRDMARKSIYRIARETQAPAPVPEGFAPHITVCDAGTAREQVATFLRDTQYPLFGFVARGRSAKAGIRAGADSHASLQLPYTLYISTAIPAADANRIAARLYALLYNPVSLMLLD